MGQLNYTLAKLNNVPVSGTNTYASELMNLSQLSGASIQVVFSGTPTGTLSLMASNDVLPPYILPQAFTPTNWTAVQTQAIAAPQAPLMLTPPSLSYRWLQVVYINASGSGSITATADVTL